MQGVSHAMGELLAQVRPGVATPVLAFTGSELRTEIILILAAIDPGEVLSVAGETNIAIYHDDSGSSTFDQSTLIWSETRLQLLQEPPVFQAQHRGSGFHVKQGVQIAVETADANEVKF